MRSEILTFGPLALSLCLGCAAEIGSGEDGQDGEDGPTGEIAEEVTFVKSNDSSVGAGRVTIVDTFRLTLVSATADWVTGVEDDMELKICVRDAETNEDIDCLATRDQHIRAGQPLVAGGNFFFRKGRNSVQDYGDFSSGEKSKFKIWVRLKTRDGIDRQTQRQWTCTWRSNAREYECEGSSALGNSSFRVGTGIIARDILVSSSLDTSACSYGFTVGWMHTQISGTLAPRASSGGGDDGNYWHHFTPPTFLPNNDIGARLSVYSGNADLYARNSSTPTRSRYNCRPRLPGLTTEECIIDGKYFSVRNRSTSRESRYGLYLENGGLAPLP